MADFISFKIDVKFIFKMPSIPNASYILDLKKKKFQWFPTERSLTQDLQQIHQDF